MLTRISIDLSSSIIDTEPRFTFDENPDLVLLKPIFIKGTGVLGRIIKNRALRGIETMEIVNATFKMFKNLLEFINSSFVSLIYVRSKIAKTVKISIKKILIKKIHDILKSEEPPKRRTDNRYI